jgi:predicted nucleotidyltransferase
LSLRIFGSVARGANRENSDVDFLVEFEPSRTLFDLIALRLDLKELLGTELARLSHLKGIFDYFRLGTVVKLNACNRGMAKAAAVKTYPL